MKVMVIGLGNIGSALVRLVFAMLRGRDEGGELVLVDPDSYDPGNLVSQLIDREDVGRNKAVAQARRLRRLNPRVKITTFPTRLENVPLGVFAGCDVVFTCLDSKAARVAANERVWRAGVKWWFDTGVSADERLARLTIHRPGPDAGCYECGWDAADYAQLDVSRPCADASAPSTGAPAALGCLAASIAVLEFEKQVLRGDDGAGADKEIIVSATAHTHCISVLKRDARCRFDHHPLNAEPADVNVREIMLGDFWQRFGDRDAALRVEGGRWLTSFVCGSCRALQPTLAVRGRGLAETEFCAACGSGRLVPSGFHQRDSITRADVSEAQLGLQLCHFGVRQREIVSFISPDQTTRSILLS